MPVRRVFGLPSLLVAGLLVLMLGACSLDCPACGSLPQPEPQVLSVDFELCVSKVPDPFTGQVDCADMRVQYVVVND
jgi:hypothetical protein